MGLFSNDKYGKSFKGKPNLNTTLKDVNCEVCGASVVFSGGTFLTCNCDDCGCTRTCSWGLQYYFKDNTAANLEIGTINIEPGDTTTTITLPSAAAATPTANFELGLLGINVIGNSPVTITAQSYSGTGYISAALIPAPHDLVSNTDNFIADLAIEGDLAGTYQVVVDIETDCGNVNITFEYTLT